MSNKKDLLEQLREEGVSDRIVDAFSRVDREKFVPDPYKPEAYRNSPLPIGSGQTISQPSTIAFMLQKLEVENRQRILEVGSGSGYVLALLKELSPRGQIYGAERVQELAERSRELLQEEDNIHIFHTPEDLGLWDRVPFDRILVSAAAERDIPVSLWRQLGAGGVIVCPVENTIIKGRKDKEGRISTEEYPGFAFVPLIIQ